MTFHKQFYKYIVFPRCLSGKLAFWTARGREKSPSLMRCCTVNTLYCYCHYYYRYYSWSLYKHTFDVPAGLLKRICVKNTQRGRNSNSQTRVHTLLKQSCGVSDTRKNHDNNVCDHYNVTILLLKVILRFTVAYGVLLY